MAEKFKKYAGKEIDVEFSGARCIHAAECVHNLPGVFDPDARPWIKPDGGNGAEIAKSIALCPSGALRYKLKQGPEEKPDVAPTGQVTANGPVYLRGEMDLGGTKEKRVALCRCGASHNKPYCDNSHEEIRFKEEGCIAAKVVQAGASKAGALRLTPFPNGPVQIEGPLTLKNVKGEVIYQGEKCFLCRCGASQAKPMCDGSHAKAAFTT
ncbi:MAG: CDGSH iron-sulfur domain-containing protein [Planctomycetes bacterium]|nr:CDGSH iron-sulfur domain-containing protein [Planctomycetota bacterium]